MLIDPKQLEHWIDHFYGYGSWNAPVWFVSFEEGGGDLPEEVSEKISYFWDQHASGTTAILCNIRELYQHASYRNDGPKGSLFRNYYDYRFGPNAQQGTIWKNLIAFSHSYNGELLPDLLTYQKNELATASNREALITLYPLPSPHNHAWYYSWLDMPALKFLKSRTLYQESVYPTRINTILQQLKRCKPQLILMYGMSNINALKNSIQSIFPEAKFKTVNAIKLQTPQYHWTDLKGTKLLITTQVPALRHNRIESGFDWEAFGKAVRTATH